MKISQVWQKQATGSLTSSHVFQILEEFAGLSKNERRKIIFIANIQPSSCTTTPLTVTTTLRPTFTHKEECQEPDGLITKQVNNVTWCQWETVFSLTFCSFSLTDQNIWSTRSGRRTLNTPTSGPKLCYRHTNTRHAADLTSATLHWRRRKTWEQGKQREEEKEGEWSSCSVKD